MSHLPVTPKNNPNYHLTPAQVKAVADLAIRFKKSVDDLLADACPECGRPESACLMIPLAGMYFGVERDGYTHT